MQTARKYSYYEQLVEEKQTAPRRGTVKKPNSKARTAAVQGVLCLAVVFVSMVLVLVRYSQIAEKKVHIYHIKSEMKQMELTQDEMNAELDRSLDLELIEKTAIEQLGMQYPTSTQIVYIQDEARYTLKEAGQDSYVQNDSVLEKWVKSLPWIGNKIAALQSD